MSLWLFAVMCPVIGIGSFLVGFVMAAGRLPRIRRKTAAMSTTSYNHLEDDT